MGLAAHDPSSGQSIWTNGISPVGGTFVSAPVVDNDGTTYVVGGSTLFAVDFNGNTLWSVSGPRYELAIAPNGNIVTVCGDQWRLCAISKAGAILWTATGPTSLSRAPSIDSQGVIHVASADALLAFGSDGILLRSRPIQPPSSAAPLIFDDGLIYLAGTQQQLLLAGNAKLADSAWPTRNRDRRNSRNMSGLADMPLSNAPYIKLVTPRSGAVVAIDVNQAVPVQAKALDIKDGELTAQVRWTSSRDGTLATGPSISTAMLNQGTHLITATVTDADGLTSSDSFTVDVGYRAPTITILNLSDSTAYEAGVPLQMSASAADEADGDLSTAVRWRSSIDGQLGTGSPLTVPTLSVGTHLITATVADSNGTTASSSAYIVVARNPPLVAIDFPGTNYTVQVGTAVQFRAYASDQRDGVISESVVWTSSLDGVFGSGASVEKSDLSVGSHTITASVTDSDGQTVTDSRTMAVQSGTNKVPTIQMSSPVPDAQFYAGDSVRLQASASDPESGSLTAIQWTSSLDGALGTGTTLTRTNLQAGEHTIRALVADSAGARAAANRTIRILPVPANFPPVVTITSLGMDGRYASDSTLPLVATAIDREQGDLGSSIVWTSDIDGELGRGAVILVRNLTAAPHVITASVVDSGGVTGRASRSILVRTGIEAVHLMDGFGNSTAYDPLPGWQIVNDGTLTPASAWRVRNGRATETAGAFRGSTAAADIDKPGTYLLSTAGAYWTDYRVRLTLRSPDDDGIGLMFRVQDNDNYYRFSMDRERSVRRLVRKANGTFTLLWQDAVQYEQNTDYQLAVTVLGSSIIIEMDGEEIYRGSDASVRRGSVGLYSWNSLNAAFDDVEVTNLTTADSNTEPLVTIASPANDALVVRGALVTFTGTAVDLEDGTLSSTLGWSSDLDGPLGTGSSLSLSTLRLGAHTITATSRDSRNASGTAAVHVTVNERVNTPPTLNVMAPASGASFMAGTNVTFSGTATDAEDGTISNGIAWSSNLDGPLGSGANLSVSTLREGTHTITASITDSEGGITTITRALTITAFVNQAPVVTITAPASGATYTVGDLIAFTATATDAEDGTLTSLISWSSSIDGTIGTTGQVSTSTLSAGTHTISASVRDSMNATHARTISVTVAAARPTLMSDNFSDNNYNGWTVVTEAGTTSGPGAWSASGGALRQTSGVYSSPTTAASVPKPGTYIHYAAGGSWTNYTVEADLRSSDADAFGVMFRYQNASNYYRFSMDRTLSQRRLVKKVGGSFTVLREDGTRFNTNQTYHVSITVNGSAVTVLIDGVQFYSGSDSSLASGSVGMYTWRNSGASFDEIVVRGFAPSADNRGPDIGLEGPLVMLAQSLDTAESVFGEGDILVSSPAFQFGIAKSAPISWMHLRQAIPIDALLALGARGGVQ